MARHTARSIGDFLPQRPRHRRWGPGVGHVLRAWATAFNGNVIDMHVCFEESSAVDHLLALLADASARRLQLMSLWLAFSGGVEGVGQVATWVVSGVGCQWVYAPHSSAVGHWPWLVYAMFIQGLVALGVSCALLLVVVCCA
jgi:hypothetical protein